MLDQHVINSHYSRAGRLVSWGASVAVLLLAASLALAQYPGQIAKPEDKDKAPVLRAVAVLEWTGDLGKPKKARLIPLTVFDGQDLQDGDIYMARPEPLALAGEVEYELRRAGKNIGLFDVENSAQEEGMWVGYGTWKPMPAPKPEVVKAPAPIEDEDNDRPVLHRKHQSDNSGKTGGQDSGGPTLHRKDSDDSSTAPAPDPDRPVLHKAPESSDSGTQASTDNDRPKLQKKSEKTEDVGHVEDLPAISDPDRPRLIRGKSEDTGPKVTPSLMGLPKDLEQAVAVSDARNLPEHPWTYEWANPADELKLKAMLEDQARAALGLTPAAAPAVKTKAVKTTHGKTRLTLPPLPAPLMDERFQVFELSYGAGATLVLSAHTDAPPAQQKFVTLIAQPDLYGGLLILLKNVTDAAHLDDTPRMRLIDAVDAESDNRGELVFELRGATQRRFVLYRVLRGQATRIYQSVPGTFGAGVEAQ